MTVGGTTKMPWWCADSLDIHINVRTSTIKELETASNYTTQLTGAIPYGGSYFGKGTTLLEIIYISCNGNETSIVQCSNSSVQRLTNYNIYNQYYVTLYSTSNNSAGVSCLGPSTNIPECSNGDVLLADGPSTREGRLKICKRDGFWASVCVTGVSKTAALIVCRSLGINTKGLCMTTYVCTMQ